MKTTTSTIKQTALRLLAGLIFFLLLAPMVAGEEASTPPTYWEDQISNVDKIVNDNGGDGTSWEQAIRIASAKELAYFAQQVNKGEAIYLASGDSIEPKGKDQAGGFLGYYFALSADIYLEDHYWTPIGTENKPFKAYFDGRGHCVSGLKVKVKVKENVYEKSDPAYAGLFGNAYNGTIQNLGVRLAEEGVQATAENGFAYAGGIAGLAKIIYCCYVEGPGSVKAVSSEIGPTINSGSYAGGIAGYLFDYPILTHCYATVAVKADAKSKSYAGGIVGWSSTFAKISNTYATGTIEATSQGTKNYAGGIVGYVKQNSDFKHNLALNDSVKANNSNRMVGDNESNVTSNSNYASPEMLVNGKTVSGGVETDKNGNPDVNLDNFGKVFSGDKGWDTSNTRLPKLRMRTGDGLDYEDWPNNNQLTLPAYDYLQADKITNASGGNGLSWKNAIQIANRVELAYLAKQVNAGKDLAVSNNVASGSIKNEGDYKGFKGIYFALAADIDLEEHYWKPIGTYDNPFNGNFDGRGYCVSGLKVKVDKNSGYTYAGLFGNTDVGTIQNLGVHLAEEGVRITNTNNMEGLSCAGGIAGQAQNVHNCYVVGKGSIEIKGGDGVDGGGIVGSLTSGGSLTNCYATVDIKIENSGIRYAGGIVGYCNSNSTISYTYATGDVETGTASLRYYAGGICGYLINRSTIKNSLALNRWITGGNDGKGNSFSNRIVGKKEGEKALTTNYASPEMEVNGKTSPDNQVDNENGANTWLSSFEADLKKEPAGDANGWVKSWTFTSGNLPQLKKKTVDGYEEWTSKQQTPLNASLYLPPSPKLHIVSPTGGTLKVTDKDGNKLSDGSDIRPGTLLKLAYIEAANYGFSGYLFGSDESSLSSYGDNSITMPDADLYLSATFTVYPKLHIVSPTGGTLKVTGNDGKELSDGNYILPGTLLTLAYTEGANYRFSEYLSGSDEDNLNSYDNNSITMPDADLYLSATFTVYPKLHIVSPTGGTLKVTGNEGKELSDGNYILPGTVLTLAYTEDANYRFSEYLSGSDKSSLKSYGSNSIRMTDDDLYLSATFTYQEPTPPYVPPVPVFYSVYLPQVEGATTDPAPGEYKVESWDNFRFTLKIDSAYNESQPVVTTSRGETLQPRSIDGSYLVKYVRSDVEVFIDGIFKNTPPVANEAISADVLAPQIWAEGSMLCIRMAEALPSAPVRIFTPDGRLHASFASTPGLNRRQLPTGIYIVRVGETVCKVLIR